MLCLKKDISNYFKLHITIGNSPIKISPGLKFNELEFSYGEKIINIPAYSGNDSEEFINVNRFANLEELIIGKNSFMKVTSVIIDHREKLKDIFIHCQSFFTPVNTQLRGSFKVSNCNQLETITIDCLSCIHFCNDFVLLNLPSLKTLKVGEIGKYSSNFFRMSFCLKGDFYPNRVLSLDLPSLESVVLGDEVFQFSLDTVFESSFFSNSHDSDLPSLRTIELGYKALMGCDNDQCRLSMQSCFDSDW